MNWNRFIYIFIAACFIISGLLFMLIMSWPNNRVTVRGFSFIIGFAVGFIAAMYFSKLKTFVK